MHARTRPDRRDWLAGLTAGAAFGLLFLGVAARVGMRLFAHSAGQAPTFTIEGSVAVSLLGALTGAIVAVLFLSARAALPTHRWIRGVLFWTACGALALRGLNPVTTTKAEIFLPLFLIHGVLLHTFWCRVWLARRQLAGASA